MVKNDHSVHSWKSVLNYTHRYHANYEVSQVIKDWNIMSHLQLNQLHLPNILLLFPSEPNTIFLGRMAKGMKNIYLSIFLLNVFVQTNFLFILLIAFWFRYLEYKSNQSINVPLHYSFMHSVTSLKYLHSIHIFII